MSDNKKIFIKLMKPIDYIAPIPDFTDAEQAAARLLGPASEIDPEILNTIDPLHQMYYKQRRSLIRRTCVLLEQSLTVTEENYQHFLKLVDECIKYLEWKDSPYKDEEKIIFMQFITILCRKIRPEDSCADKERVSLWRKTINHIFDGNLPRYTNQAVEEFITTVSQLKHGNSSSQEVWQRVQEKDVQMDKLLRILELQMVCVEVVGTPEISKKMSDIVLPTLMSSYECITIQLEHPDHKLTRTLFGSVYNIISSIAMCSTHSITTRNQLHRICRTIRHSPTKTDWQHQKSLKILAASFPIHEIETQQPLQLIMSDEDIEVMMTNLKECMNEGKVTILDISSPAYDEMDMLWRFFIVKENRRSLLNYRFEDLTGTKELILKGVESSDKRVQIPSLKCLKIMIEEDAILNSFRTDENCLSVLKGTRKSPDLLIRQMAMEVMMKIMIKNPTELKVTRKRLERSSCITWTESDVRSRITECGYVLPADVDWIGCDGEWLIELLVMRRENNVAYFGEIENRFNIMAKDSIPFNTAMRKIEKLVLSHDLNQEPEPYQSIN